MSNGSALADALGRLDVLVGRWAVEPGGTFEGTPEGTATIEWALDHRFLVWWASIPDRRFPESIAVISINSDGHTYRQHYFDSNGNARIYKMSLEADAWTLLRDEPDFTPLEFSQRFVARIDRGGETITGAWESRGPEGGWQKDFDLVYRKLPPEE
ncbi:MAG TPA: hypothetical protein VG244_02365 [Acidimicrobiales bacterium]|jgi:hypothetical protein|nr:hypothetical protein [Acidimicrobiales bacterium]